MGWGDFSEADGMVIAMLLAMALSAGVVLMLVVTMLRNAARRNREVDDLLEEMDDEEREAKPGAPVAAGREPWEKDGDWWKRGEE